MRSPNPAESRQLELVARAHDDLSISFLVLETGQPIGHATLRETPTWVNVDVDLAAVHDPVVAAIAQRAQRLYGRLCPHARDVAIGTTIAISRADGETYPRWALQAPAVTIAHSMHVSAAAACRRFVESAFDPSSANSGVPGGGELQDTELSDAIAAVRRDLGGRSLRRELRIHSADGQTSVAIGSTVCRPQSRPEPTSRDFEGEVLVDGYRVGKREAYLLVLDARGRATKKTEVFTFDEATLFADVATAAADRGSVWHAEGDIDSVDGKVTAQTLKSLVPSARQLDRAG